MSFFYVTFLAIICFSFDYVKPLKKDAWVFLFLFVYLFFLINIVFLTELPDIAAYLGMYEKFQRSGIIDTHSEVGYRFFANIFAKLGVNFYVFRTILITASVFLFFSGIRKLSSNFSVSILYFYTTIFVISYLIQIRTGLGLSIFVGLGLPAFKKKHYFKTFISILIATLFHTSMVALVCPFFFLLFPCNKKLKLFFTFLVFVASYINIFDILIDFVSNYFAQTKIRSYINASGNAEAGLSMRDFLSVILLFLFATRTNKNKFDNLMFWSFYCGTIFKIIFRNFGEVGVRLSLLFQYPLIFIMPLFIDKKKTYRSWLTIFLVILFCFVNFYFWISNYGSGKIIGNSFFKF